MKALFSAALAAVGIYASAMAGAAAAPANDATMRAAADLSTVQSVRLEGRHVAPRHHRRPTVAMQATAPIRSQPGTVYQDGSYTYTLGPDGRRWYEPTICNWGPQ